MSTILSLVPYLIMCVITGIPVYLILKRAGFSGAWAILCILPLFSAVPLWILALSKWKADDGAHERLEDVFK